MNKILVDTSVWSVALRRSKPNEREIKIIQELGILIRNYQIAIIGAIRQELLSGISNQTVFENLRDRISVFSDYIVRTDDYERAAEYANICRKNGIQGSHTDFLICAVTARNGWKIFSKDKKYLPIELYQCD